MQKNKWNVLVRTLNWIFNELENTHTHIQKIKSTTNLMNEKHFN